MARAWTRVAVDHDVMKIALPLPVVAGILVLALAQPAVGLSLPQLTYQLSGSELRPVLTGPVRTGAWRIRVVAPGGEQRTDFVLRTGDVAWNGVARVSRWSGANWVVRRTFDLDRSLAGRTHVAACAAGICWDTADFRLPRDGDRKFAVLVELTRPGVYRLSGAVRVCPEAFIYGPWVGTGSRLIRR